MGAGKSSQPPHSKQDDCNEQHSSSGLCAGLAVAGRWQRHRNDVADCLMRPSMDRLSELCGLGGKKKKKKKEFGLHMVISSTLFHADPSSL